MHCKSLLSVALCCVGCIIGSLTLAAPAAKPRTERHLLLRSRLAAPLKLQHSSDDLLLNQLDATLQEITDVHMQALFSATHTPELEVRMRATEVELFDLLDALYHEQRMADYMQYEREVSRQMILYSMLKKLFGYSGAESEEIE